MHRLRLVAVLVLLLATPIRAEEEPRVIGQLFVDRDGPVQVTAAALAKLGAPSAALVEVRRHGKTVASRVEEGGLRFEAVETASNHTRHAAYRLWRHKAPRTDSPPAPRPATDTHSIATDRVYGGLASEIHEIYARPTPVWFLARLPHGKSASVDFAARGLDRSASMQLDVIVYAAHRGATALEATWGDLDLGRAEVPSAAGGATLRWTVPAGQAPAETAALRLVDVSPPIPARPSSRDVSAEREVLFIDAVSVTGTTADARTPVREIEPRPLTQIPDPLAVAGAARHVIIAVPVLVEEARRLAAHRTATGTPSAVIPVTGIYARYGHGEHTPQAIRAFVLDLLARPGAPLDYLLLAGDATFDRTDRVAEPTIPTLMTRSIYNGATAADPLYVVAGDGQILGSPAVGRLPFRKAEPMKAYVDRVIRYETNPTADASRRMFRFITSEARFGPMIDRLIENKFRSILSENIAPGFDIEGTYASASSPFLWPPPEFNDKVIDGLNQGALFFTYVGHGFAQGFDTLRVKGGQHRILHIDDVERVDIQGTLPVVFVLACTTALFDGWRDGVGEALMKRSRGPVAYWGASRICHPAYNALSGQAIATHMARVENASAPPRLGRILGAARDEVLGGKTMPFVRTAIRMFSGKAKLEHLVVEGAMMYTLLGDPALKIAFPREDVGIETRVEASEVVAQIRSDLPDGTRVHVSLELPRDRNAADPTPVRNPEDPASFPAIRAKHAAMNDWALVRADATLSGGNAEVRLPLGEHEPGGLIVKAWCIAGDDLHQGAAVLE